MQGKKIAENFQLNYSFHISSVSKLKKAVGVVLAIGIEPKKEERSKEFFT